MPRKKIIPEENPEQVNEMEMSAPEGEVEGLEQPAADVLQEEAPPPEDTGLPLAELPDAPPPEEPSAMEPFWMEADDSPAPPLTPSPRPRREATGRTSSAWTSTPWIGA